jgi:hypothetical protein
LNIVSSKQKTELKRLIDSGGPQAPYAAEILKCVDKGVAPPPEAIEWFIKWMREKAA